jgi:hypothetical protein
VDGYRVVDAAMDVFLREGGDQPIPVGHPDRVDVVYVLPVRGLLRDRDALHSLQELAVPGCVPAPRSPA